MNLLKFSKKISNISTIYGGQDCVRLCSWDKATTTDGRSHVANDWSDGVVTHYRDDIKV